MSYSSAPNIVEFNDYVEPLRVNLNTFESMSVQPLAGEDKNEALQFLAVRPVHTVIIDGFLRENGIYNPFNRGKFYVCRNRQGSIKGVALIGHYLLIETTHNGALKEFAKLARAEPKLRLVMGEAHKIERLWSHYLSEGPVPFSLERELLLEQRWPVEALPVVPGLRLATLEDLDLVATAHASVAAEERGANLIEKDPVGFVARCARRIAHERVWVWIEDGRLIFKVDIVSETPHVTYLEGAYVYPSERGKGFGLRCFSQLSRQILSRTESICLLVNEKNRTARSFYTRVGFTPLSQYDSIFVNNV
jgi:predicted GNAT family acetyltransferase